MHLAAAQGHVDMVELLAFEGCDVSPVDRFGRGPRSTRLRSTGTEAESRR